MGGGMVFRGVARLVGAASVGAAVTPSTGAFCHVCPAVSNPSREQESLLAVLDDAQQEFCNANLIEKDCDSYVNVRYEHEETEVDKPESSRGGAFRQFVFYPPPTEEEVEEATKELHAALHLAVPAQGFVTEEIPSVSLVDLTSNADDMDVASTPSEMREVAASSSSSLPFNNLGNFVVENSTVMQAFQLLQTNPKVQDVVKSLACDPAVWNAVLSNQKLLELTQEESPDSQESVDYDDEDYSEMKELGIVLASKLLGFMSTTKVYYSIVRAKLLCILNGMFGSLVKTLQSKGKSAKDKTVASCMMLTVAVVLLVVVRRSLKKS